MLSWLRRRRERFERIEIEADALIRDLGADAYSLAGGGSARLVRTRGEILEPSYRPLLLAPRPAILLICEQLFGRASRGRIAAARPRSDETNARQTPSLETEVFGQRLSTAFDRRWPTNPPNSCRRPRPATLTLYNVARLWNYGNRRGDSNRDALGDAFVNFSQFESRRDAIGDGPERGGEQT